MIYKQQSLIVSQTKIILPENFFSDISMHNISIFRQKIFDDMCLMKIKYAILREKKLKTW